MTQGCRARALSKCGPTRWRLETGPVRPSCSRRHYAQPARTCRPFSLAGAPAAVAVGGQQRGGAQAAGGGAPQAQALLHVSTGGTKSGINSFAGTWSWNHLAIYQRR